MNRVSLLSMVALALAGAAGCSRTADGTLIPLYTMSVTRFAGLPVLTLQRVAPVPSEASDDGTAPSRLEAPGALPLDAAIAPADRAEETATAPETEAPPARAAAPASAVTGNTAARPRGARTRPVAAQRVALRSPRPVETSEAERTLLCRNQASPTRAVSVVCE